MATCCWMMRTSAGVFGSTRMYEIVNRVFGMYCEGPAVGRVERRDAEQPARGDLGHANDDAAVIVDLEGRANRRILELSELGVLDGEKPVLGEDVFDVAFDELGAAEQARVIEAENGDPLIDAALQLDQAGPGIERHGILHAGDAAHFVQDVVGQGIELATVWTAGSITQTLAPMLITVADERLRMPENSDVISIIRNTANVIPTSKAENFARSLTRSL